MSLRINQTPINSNTLVYQVEKINFESLSFSNSIEVAFEKGIKNIICDLSELESINYLGLISLINVYKKTRALGGEFILTNVSPRVEVMLLITKLSSFFITYNLLKEAISSLNLQVSTN